MADGTFRSFHLFCGSGGDGKGYAKRGFIVTGFDIDPRARDDFGRLTGRPAHHLDIATAQPADLAALEPECPDVLVLSAPCKGYSGLMGEAKSASAPYQVLNSLAIRGLMLVLGAYGGRVPKLILFENVPRITSRGKELLAQVEGMLQHLGYSVVMYNHCCGEVGGLAQRRRRFLLRARHLETCPDYVRKPPKQRVRPIAEQLFTLPVPRPTPHPTPALPGGDPMHVLSKMSRKNWARVASVRPGYDWKDIPHELEVVDCDSDEALRVGLRWPECKGRQDGKLGVMDPSLPAHTIISSATPTKGWSAIADDRVALGPGSMRAARQNGGYGVEAADAPAHAVVARGGLHTARLVVEDIRLGCSPRNGAYGVNDAELPSSTVIGHHDVDCAPATLADQRIALDHVPRNGSYGVLASDQPADTVRGHHSVRQAPGVVADIRVPWDPADRKGRPDCYGVADADEPSVTVRATQEIQSARSAVADSRVSRRRGRPRPVDDEIQFDERGWAIPTHTMVRFPDGRVALYGPRLDFDDKRGCYLVILSIELGYDGGDLVVRRRWWARGLSLRELADLQSFPRDFIFCGPATSSEAGTGQKERIGNGIPVETAYAIADEDWKTLEASAAGGFRLAGGDIWVQPEEEAAHA